VSRRPKPWGNSDRDKSVRVAAAYALGKIGSEARSAINALQEAAAKTKDDYLQKVADALKQGITPPDAGPATGRRRR
jgi:HEAT repeat protein